MRMANGLGKNVLRGLLVSQLTLILVGCSGSNSPSGSNGGAASPGGASTSGGSSALAGIGGATGGSNATGGTTSSEVTVSGGTTSSANTGGSAAVGGKTASGGATAAGGSIATGGKSAAGGGNATGGKSTTGGGNATGGTSAPGSTSATGGSSVTGGGTGSPGGANATGGTKAGGGTSATGGTTTTAGASSTSATHWVGSWTASPYVDTNSNNTPPIALSNTVIRQVTHVSLGGSQIRVQFSNLWGNGSLAINGAHIALCKASPSVDSTIDPATDKALTFAGTASATIAQGKELWSDPIDFTVANQGNITITTSFGTVPSTLTQHSGSRTTSYFKASGTTADLSAANMSTATSKALWFFISGIDVMADASAGGIVAVGDSITDGRGSDTDQNNRWTDVLAARLQANAATAKISMMNQAIGATNVSGTATTSAQSRFARDVLGQSGVKYVIILEGVNDIHGGFTPTTINAAYKDMIDRAHAHNPKLLVFGGTITPFGGSTTGSDPYYSDAAETARQTVNTYIKSGVFDGVIDFDAAVTDGGNPPKLQTTYATWAQTDGLHPSPAGYKKMGEAADLTLFTK